MLKKSIPNAITCLNLLCGNVGVIFALQGDLELALYLMLAATAFDFLDGFAARLLGAYSELGKQLDSLADLVSFGVLPSMMLFSQTRISHYGVNWLCFVPILIAVFSGLRLAKFNLDSRQSKSFLGLPTPACAIFCAATCSVIAHNPDSFLAIWAMGDIFIPIISIVLSALLVCEIPMFSLKFSKEDSSALRIKRLALALIAAAAVVICLIFSLHWSIALLICISSYILKNIIYSIVKI